MTASRREFTPSLRRTLLVWLYTVNRREHELVGDPLGRAHPRRATRRSPIPASSVGFAAAANPSRGPLATPRATPASALRRRPPRRRPPGRPTPLSPPGSTSLPIWPTAPARRARSRSDHRDHRERQHSRVGDRASSSLRTSSSPPLGGRPCRRSRRWDGSSCASSSASRRSARYGRGDPFAVAQREPHHAASEPVGVRDQYAQTPPRASVRCGAGAAAAHRFIAHPPRSRLKPSASAWARDLATSATSGSS